jgi:hypothetical protein
MAKALITLEEYKDLQQIAGKPDDDEVLQTYINGVSQLVKTYCGYSFVDYFDTFKTEVFSIENAQSFVQLEETPIIAGSVTVKERSSLTTTFASITALTENADYYIDNTTDTIFKISGSRAMPFQTGPGRVEVVYKAGYDIGNKLLPGDLSLAVADLVTYYYKDQTKSRQTIAGASLQVNPTSTQRDSIGFPDHIKRILDLYKSY